VWSPAGANVSSQQGNTPRSPRKGLFATRDQFAAKVPISAGGGVAFGLVEELIGTGQAARVLGVTKPTLLRAIERGWLRPVLVTPGGHRRFRRSDLIAVRTSGWGDAELTGIRSVPAVVNPAITVITT
jgi:excisionase family DNA binding protein